MRVDAICERGFAPALEAVERSRIPGATLGVVRADGESAVRFAGMAALVPEREALTDRPPPSGPGGLLVH